MKPGGPVKYVTIKLTPEGARQALRALTDMIEVLGWPSISSHLTETAPRVGGQLRLLALLLERSLDEIDQLAPRWPSQSGSIHKIHPRKIP